MWPLFVLFQHFRVREMSSTDRTFIILDTGGRMVLQEVSLQLRFVGKPQVAELARELVRDGRMYTKSFPRKLRIIVFGANGSAHLARVFVFKTLRPAVFFFDMLLQLDRLDEGAITLFTLQIVRGFDVFGKQLLLAHSKPFLTVLTGQPFVLTVINRNMRYQGLNKKQG